MTYLSFLNFSEEVSWSAPLSEKLQSFLTSGLAGYLLVFVVLGLIWLILEIFGKAFTQKADDNTTEIVIESSPKPAIPEPQPVITEAPADDEAIVAAIVAAISAYTNKSSNGFRVVSFKKK